MFVFFVNTLLQNMIAEQNVPTQPPTRTDKQIVFRSQWLTIGKSNLLFNAQKIQKNPIFQISDILEACYGKVYSRDPAIFPHRQVTKPVMKTQIRNNNNIFGRHVSAVHHTGEDFYFRKISSLYKSETIEVFGMAIPDPLILKPFNNLRIIPYDEAQQESVPQEEGDDHDLELAKKMSLEAHQEKGEGEGADADMKRAIKLSLDPAFLPQGQAPVGGSNDRDPSVIQALMIRTNGPLLLEDDTSVKLEWIRLWKFHASLAGPIPELMDAMNSTLQPTQRVHETEDLNSECVIEEKSKVVDESDSTIPESKSSNNEDAMDKEVKDRVKNHKRKHDSDDDEDDDDDEGPSAGSNQGKSTKREDTIQITDTRDAVVDSSMHRSDPELEHSKQKKSFRMTFTMQMKGRPATPELEWTIPPNDFPEPENNWENTYATTYQVHIENKLQRKTYDIGSFIKWFCRRTREDEALSGDKERKIALSISKLKAARYLDFGLEELVPSLWVESERDYDISAAYGITHWWFRRKEFYINKHSEPSDREAVRSQMRILSVISVKVFEKYGYNYLREIILRRADYQEYKISEKDFKNLHPNDFEDLFLLNIQEKLNHLPKTDKTSLHTAVNMWIRNLDRNDQEQFDEAEWLHKFSDGTLDKSHGKDCDHMVKDFHLFEYNKGMETRKWSEDDKRRSKDFITAIEKRLQIRRIFRSLESFVGGRIRDIDYRLINRTT
ncbi:hypothetical protein Tco_0491509 [Tanacetum coccineum]